MMISRHSCVFTSLLLCAAPFARATELLLFGGPDNKTFAGCLNCGKYDAESVCNKYGDHGSKYGDGIWNPYSQFGSKYNSDSPWNKYSSSPPAIVDADGKFYGYFTANRYAAKRTRIKELVEFTDAVDWVTEDLDRARDAFCGD